MNNLGIVDGIGAVLISLTVVSVRRKMMIVCENESRRSGVICAKLCKVVKFMSAYK